MIGVEDYEKRGNGVNAGNEGLVIGIWDEERNSGVVLWQEEMVVYKLLDSRSYLIFTLQHV